MNIEHRTLNIERSTSNGKQDGAVESIGLRHLAVFLFFLFKIRCSMLDVRRSSLNRGFTLLEVMIAVAIIALALTTLLGLQTRSVSLANEAKFFTTAALLAQERMAAMEVEQPDRLVGGAGDFGAELPDYRWEVTVSDVDVPEVEGLADHLKRIDVIVFRGSGDQYRYPLRLYRFVE
jgi:general secretion pathway protein I